MAYSKERIDPPLMSYFKKPANCADFSQKRYNKIVSIHISALICVISGMSEQSP